MELYQKSLPQVFFLVSMFLQHLWFLLPEFAQLYQESWIHNNFPLSALGFPVTTIAKRSILPSTSDTSFESQ